MWNLKTHNSKMSFGHLENNIGLIELNLGTLVEVNLG